MLFLMEVKPIIDLHFVIIPTFPTSNYQIFDELVSIVSQKSIFFFYIHPTNKSRKSKQCLFFPMTSFRTLIREKCGEKSLVELEYLISTKGFQYACQDDPEELILIMCGNQWEARECQIARSVLRQAWDAKLNDTSPSKRNSYSFLLVCLTVLAEMFFLVKFQ